MVGARAADPRAAASLPVVRGDRAEQAVALFVGPGGEEERLGRSSRVVVPEAEGPEPVRERLAIAAAKLAAMGEVPVRQLLVGVDVPVAEVADGPVEAPEALRCQGEAPGRVQLAVLRHAIQEVPVS